MLLRACSECTRCHLTLRRLTRLFPCRSLSLAPPSTIVLLVVSLSPSDTTPTSSREMGWFSFLRLRRVRLPSPFLPPLKPALTSLSTRNASSSFLQSSEPDYETLLSGLEQRIKARESHLLSIRLRERRANALFITYGLGAWIVYVALWWFGVVRAEAGVEKVVRGLPVAGGPVV